VRWMWKRPRRFKESTTHTSRRNMRGRPRRCISAKPCIGSTIACESVITIHRISIRTCPNLPELAELDSAATGLERSVEDLKRPTMRQVNLEKALNLRFTDFDWKIWIKGGHEEILENQ
jgi:hypothetical protein